LPPRFHWKGSDLELLLAQASGAAGLVEGIEDVAGAPVFRLSLRGADTLEDQLGRAILRARQSDRSKAS
jgi:hypothetical protein